MNLLYSRRGQIGGYGIAILLLIALFLVTFFFPQYFRLRSGIYRLSCREIRAKVEVAVNNYQFNNTHSIVQPGKTIDLDALKADGFLMDIQYCPEGGRFFYGPQGEVLCSEHRKTVGDDSVKSKR
ncbi:MAG: hypothetical protein HQM09_02225 [Candidatus Riflebacteria bacterium]|nr:hypothetical protein [Candidatus Riflebacteria bacterium]